MTAITDSGMLAAVHEFEAAVSDLARPSARIAEARDVMLPPDTIVVSSDNHWSCMEDIFHEAFPRHLKPRAPRWVGRKGAGHWAVDGKNIMPPAFIESVIDFEAVEGTWSMEHRMRDLSAEGIDKEIVFPNTLGAFYGFPDLEVREWIFRTYNRYLSGLQQQAPGRFYGVGVPNFWDMAKARDSIQEIKNLGLKTLFLPQNPKGPDWTDLDYCEPEMEPLWCAIEEAGLPICFHVGEFSKKGPGALGVGAMVGFGPFRKSLGELIFGGIFDRHPSLQVVFTEADLNWIPGALQTATMIYETHREFLDPKIKHHPRTYWHNNCFATFIHDPIGMRMLDIIGADRVMWSCDYVHLESNFGYGWSAKKAVIDTVSPDQARAILGGTALAVFDLN